ncbi:MAG: hypothetical protein EHM45_02810 [Desulfobacteraceae bacterium]|nr:MAG: hypothetical protein EHM45_02810 [Desulfobacteraceae bacterium]
MSKEVRLFDKADAAEAIKKLGEEDLVFLIIPFASSMSIRENWRYTKFFINSYSGRHPDAGHHRNP